MNTSLKPLPASSRHLSVFAIDVQYHLEQTRLFSKIGVKKTGVPESALIVWCSLADASTSPEEVMKTLVKIWDGAPLGYKGKQDWIKVTNLTGEVQMRFSTSTEEVIVTGHIEVFGFN